MQTTAIPPQERAAPSTLAQFRVWLGVGLQSFGGGMATLALIRRGFVEDRDWVSDEEFTRFWAICQIAPGINLISFAILIGRGIGGAAGVAAALIGMLLPSAAITVLMTAGYTAIRDSPLVTAALRAVVPATVGLGLATAIKLAVPLVAEGRRGGRAAFMLTVAILCGSALALGLWHLPVVAVLVGSGVVGGAAYAILGTSDSSERQGGTAP